MSARVDRVIAKVRALHEKAQNAVGNPEEADYSDVMIFSHGHFSRCFIARWCDLPLKAGYHFAAEPGGVSFLLRLFFLSCSSIFEEDRALTFGCSLLFWVISTSLSRNPVSSYT